MAEWALFAGGFILGGAATAAIVLLWLSADRGRR